MSDADIRQFPKPRRYRESTKGKRIKGNVDLPPVPEEEREIEIGPDPSQKEALSDIDLAYIAGFFDGEGSVTIGLSKTAPRSRSPSHTLIVGIGNTDPTIVRFIHSHFGGGLTSRKINKENHKDITQWSARAYVATRFLEAIRPFVRMKRNQIDVALRFQYGRTHYRCGPGGSLPMEEIQWREDRRLEILRLNGRNKMLRTPVKSFFPLD